MKKLTTIILMIALLCGMIPSFSSANTDGIFEYRLLTDGTVEITKADSKCTDAVIPGELDGHPVSSIAANAFRDCGKLKSVTIPDSLVSIDEQAFLGCTKLNSFQVSAEHPVFAYSLGLLINKEDMTLIRYTGKGGTCEVYWGIRNIGKGAFEYSKVTSVILPDSVTSIGPQAFLCCSNLSSITIPNTVTSIGSQCFYLCKGLKSISLPAGLTDIDHGIFGWCTNLKSIEIDPANPVYEMKDGMLIDKKNQKLVYLLNAIKGICEVPDGIREIAPRAFEANNNLKEIIFPGSVENIQSEAIEYCKSLTSVKLPDGINEINAYMFSNCPKLTSLVIPDGVTWISVGAFEGCKGLKEVAIPASVSLISENTFADSKNLVCTVADGSYAQKFCEANSIKYVIK